MDTLTTLKNVFEENKNKYGPGMTTHLETSIISIEELHYSVKHELYFYAIFELRFLDANAEADRLFDDVLQRKEQADGTRNALGVLQRFRFLFHLPSTLDKNIQKGDYDLVINDYARAKALFGVTEVQV